MKGTMKEMLLFFFPEMKRTFFGGEKDRKDFKHCQDCGLGYYWTF